MNTAYNYELWDGKKVVGHINVLFPLNGRFYVHTTISLLKELYDGPRMETIILPIISRVIYENATDTLYRRCFDVRRKSKRQLKILRGIKK